MTVTNGDIAQILRRYLGRYPDERTDLDPVLRALDAGVDLVSRASLPGHVTCGAAVLDDLNRVLVIEHKSLRRWLLPGGHLEPADASPHDAALRELEEETGIRRQQAVSPPRMGVVPLDIDMHHIPANPAKGEPEHWHADFRYAFRAAQPALRLQLDEVTDYGWRRPADLDTARLAAKIRHMTAIALRPATPADSEFCFQLHKSAMGDYVTVIWGWDEQVQRGFHACGFDPNRWRIITADGVDIGMLSVEYRPTEIYLARIEIHPDHQGHGVGTHLITALQAEADRRGQDLVLDVLTVNKRAQALYQRLGMREVARYGENDTKITMRSSRPPL